MDDIDVAIVTNNLKARFVTNMVEYGINMVKTRPNKCPEIAGSFGSESPDPGRTRYGTPARRVVQDEHWIGPKQLEAGSRTNIFTGSPPPAAKIHGEPA